MHTHGPAASQRPTSTTRSDDRWIPNSGDPERGGAILPRQLDASRACERRPGVPERTTAESGHRAPTPAPVRAQNREASRARELPRGASYQANSGSGGARAGAGGGLGGEAERHEDLAHDETVGGSAIGSCVPARCGPTRWRTPGAAIPHTSHYGLDLFEPPQTEKSSHRGDRRGIERHANTHRERTTLFACQEWRS